ncbi:PQQ-binding-like beta-propeller repeat protein [Streptomyces sp. NPDC051217]|uniref:outer membrane protein assembly factor BamB family protein n=1 Tax=Streptomyces sp. NPDC051217 TaxID=3365644 RepID=UPI00379047AE
MTSAPHSAAPARPTEQPQRARQQLPRFRHDPRRSLLPLSENSAQPARWEVEPQVCGYRKLVHHRERQEVTIPVPVCASPVLVPGVGAVVAGYDGYIRFFNRSLSKVYWKQRLAGPIYASLVVDRSRRRIIAATTGGQVACLDLRGRPVWSMETGLPLYATPLVLPGADLLVLAAFGSRCLGLDLATGDLRFTHELPRPWQAAHGGSAAHRDPYASPVATADGEAVVACAEYVVCLAPDGTERWRRDVDSTIRSSPAALHELGQIVVCSVDGRCHFLDTSSGQPCGSVALGAKVVSSPAVSGNILVAGTEDGTAFGIDIHSRSVRWTAPGYGAHAYSSFTVLPDGNFSAVVGRGNAVGLDREDGRFRWETSQLLGLPEHDPAMDTTPVAGPDGSMYGGSYTGMIYHFRFRPIASEGPPP